jgi:hypothetical protein
MKLLTLNRGHENVLRFCASGWAGNAQVTMAILVSLFIWGIPAGEIPDSRATTWGRRICLIDKNCILLILNFSIGCCIIINTVILMSPNKNVNYYPSFIFLGLLIRLEKGNL